MIEADWHQARKGKSPYLLMRAIQLAARSARSERKPRLFAIACCRGASSLLSPTFGTLLDEVERQVSAPGGIVVESPMHAPAREELERMRQEDWLRNLNRFTAVTVAETILRTADPSITREDLMGHSRLGPTLSIGPPKLRGGTIPKALATLLRDIFGNPFRPVTFTPEWRTSTVLALAAQMYESRDFGAMPILADALQDAGCDSADILDHCRDNGVHVRGCWVVDLALGKQR